MKKTLILLISSFTCTIITSNLSLLCAQTLDEETERMYIGSDRILAIENYYKQKTDIEYEKINSDFLSAYKKEAYLCYDNNLENIVQIEVDKWKEVDLLQPGSYKTVSRIVTYYNGDRGDFSEFLLPSMLHNISQERVLYTESERTSFTNFYFNLSDNYVTNTSIKLDIVNKKAVYTNNGKSINEKCKAFNPTHHNSKFPVTKEKTNTDNEGKNFLFYFHDCLTPINQYTIIKDLQYLMNIKLDSSSNLYKEIFGNTLSGEHYINYILERVNKARCASGNYLASGRGGEISFTEFFFNTFAIVRLSGYIHEARHSMPDDNTRHIKCPDSFSDELGKDKMPLFTNKKFAGTFDCDENYRGAYGENAILLFNIAKHCINCNPSIKKLATVLANHFLERIVQKDSRDLIKKDSQ